MRQIVQAISNARVPVIVYVSPAGPGPPRPGSSSPGRPGGRHGAGTNIGAAHPFLSA